MIFARVPSLPPPPLPLSLKTPHLHGLPQPLLRWLAAPLMCWWRRVAHNQGVTHTLVL